MDTSGRKMNEADAREPGGILNRSQPDLQIKHPISGVGFAEKVPEKAGIAVGRHLPSPARIEKRPSLLTHGTPS